MMSQADLRESIRAYMDRYGLVHPWAGRGSLNGLLYTSLYYVLLEEMDWLTPEDEEQFRLTVKRCEVEPGLYRRHPENNDQEAHDDYVALAAAAAMIEPDIAKDILSYGRRRFYVYRNARDGGLHAWLGRFPFIRAHLKWAAGEEPWFWERWLWIGYVRWAARQEKQPYENWFLTWLMVQTARWSTVRRDVLEVCTDFERALSQRFPESGMAQVLAEYFGDPSHPLARYYVQI